jgi:hypothetical protein
MTRSTGAIHRLFVAVFVCLLLAPSTAAAGQRSIVADFDGDGYRDHAALDDLEPSVLRVWLSGTRTTAIVRSRSPVFGIAARDLDGDRRAELIAGTPAAELQVWTRRHATFSRYKPRPVPLGILGPAHSVGDAPDGSPVAITSTAPSLGALPPIPQPRAPAALPAALTDRPSAASPSGPANSPLAPRPPPFSR